VGGLAALGALTAGAYAFLPHAEPAAAAASIAQVKVTAHLDQLLAAFPSQVAEGAACTDSAERTPVVLYSAIAHLKGGPETAPLESELLSGALPVTGPSVTLTGRRIAIVRTGENHEPEASAAEAKPGKYDGVLVVFDASTNKPLCQTAIDATSTTDLRWADVGPRALHKDYVSSVQKAFAEASERLHVDLAY
jgi:hypothetical protein